MTLLVCAAKTAVAWAVGAALILVVLYLEEFVHHPRSSALGAIPGSHTSQLLETEELASEGEQWRDWEADSAFEHPTTELQQKQHRMIHRTGFNLNDIGTKTAKKPVASAHQHQISPSAQRGWANIIAEGQGRQRFRRNGLTELAGSLEWTVFPATSCGHGNFGIISQDENEKPPPPLHISTCKSVCLETKGCIAFVHIKKTSQCYMKGKKQCSGKALVDTPGRSTHFVPGYVVAPRLGVSKA